MTPHPRKRREKRVIELLPEQWEMFDSINRLLGHEDAEETLVVLLDLGIRAIQLTSPNDRLLRMTSGNRTEVGEPCTVCNRRQMVYDYEAVVRLGVDVPLRRPKEEPPA